MKGEQVAAKALALMGVEIMTDADLLARAKAFQEDVTGGEPSDAITRRTGAAVTGDRQRE